MNGRWMVRDRFGRAFTIVRRAVARPDERAAALPSGQAERVMAQLCGPRTETLASARAIAMELTGGALVGGQRRLKLPLETLLRREVSATGRLLVWVGYALRATAGPGCDSSARSPEQRLVEALMKGRETLTFEGRAYRFVVEGPRTSPCAAGDDAFYPVPMVEARALVLRMRASPSAASWDRAALAAAAERLADPKVVARPGGVVLQRQQAKPVYREAEAEPAVTPSQLFRIRKGSVELRIVEAGTGRPLAGVPLLFEGPDGEERHLATSPEGSLTIGDLDPGLCTFTSVVTGASTAESYSVLGSGDAGAPGCGAASPQPIRPAYLVDARPHRVRSGETLASIATAAGVAADEIARFNWQTTAPDLLENAFREKVGCAKKTADGRRHVFDDGDDPGIILIPRPWRASIAVGQVQTIIVSPLRPLYVSLENRDGLMLPGAAYQIAFVDGSERRGRLGRRGIARLTAVPDAAFSITYPEHEDLLARSLAASVRRAFDQQATGPLFYLLGQSEPVIARAVQIYEQHFDDLTGEGFEADVDRVVTDPEARGPLAFLGRQVGLNLVHG